HLCLRYDLLPMCRLGKMAIGGEGVSQPPLKDKVFSTFLDQNSPLELRPENGVSPPTKACDAMFRDWWRRRLPSKGGGHTIEPCGVRLHRSCSKQKGQTQVSRALCATLQGAPGIAS